MIFVIFILRSNFKMKKISAYTRTPTSTNGQLRKPLCKS